MTDNTDKKTYSITLNKYQRDNLLWLLNLASGHGFIHRNPFTMANTGDWVMEIAWMLSDETGMLPNDCSPNMSIDDMKKIVSEWIDRRVKARALE